MARILVAASLQDSELICPVCGATIPFVVDPDELYPLLDNPCPHLAGAEYEISDGKVEFLADIEPEGAGERE